MQIPNHSIVTISCYEWCSLTLSDLYCAQEHIGNPNKTVAAPFSALLAEYEAEGAYDVAEYNAATSRVRELFLKRASRPGEPSPRVLRRAVLMWIEAEKEASADRTPKCSSPEVCKEEVRQAYFEVGLVLANKKYSQKYDRLHLEREGDAPSDVTRHAASMCPGTRAVSGELSFKIARWSNLRARFQAQVTGVVHDAVSECVNPVPACKP